MEYETSYRIRETSEVLPPIYAHFGKLGEISASLRSVRDEEYPTTAYNTLWEAACMSFDLPVHRTLLTQLRKDGNYTQYWANLGDQSSYPTYAKVRDELKESSFAENLVHGWTYENVPLGRRKEIFDSKYIQRSRYIYPFVYSADIIRAYERTITNSQKENDYNLVRDLGMLRAGDKLPYISALKLLNTARTTIHSVLMTQIEQNLDADQNKMKIIIPDMELKLKTLLRRLEPLRVFSEEMSVALMFEEKKLFGEDKKPHLSAALWKAVTHLRYSAISKNVNHTSVRFPLLTHLVNREYDQAKSYLQEQVALYPGLLPDFAVQYLDIASDPLILSDKEQKQLRRAQREQLKEEVRQRNELAKQTPGTSQYALEVMRSHAGKILDSPDGKFSVSILHLDNGGQRIFHTALQGDFSDLTMEEFVNLNQGNYKAVVQTMERLGLTVRPTKDEVDPGTQ